MRRARAFAASALAAALLLPGAVPPARAAAAGDLLVRAGTVVPVEGEPLRPGAVLCRDGKIVAVGPSASVEAPPGVEVVDLGPHAVVLPGLVAAASGLAGPGAGGPESVEPGVRAVDGFDWFRAQDAALEGGVTTAYLDAARRRVLGGQGAVVKTAGASPEARTLVASAGLHGAVGDPARNPPALFDAPSSPDPIAHPLLPVRPQSPATRMAAVAMLREALARGAAAPVPAGAADPGLVALAAVARGEAPLRIQAEESADIRAALALAAEAKVRLVISGARDAHAEAESLAAAGVPVVFVSPITPGRLLEEGDPEAARARAAALGGPAALERRGALFAIAATDAALPDLFLVAAAHARVGLTPDRAVRAVTLDAARILGVHGRVGSLVPGKDADLACFSGDPFDMRSVPVMTVVDGRVAWRREPRKGVLVLRAGAVHAGDGRVFAPGAVVIEDGKVVECGAEVGVPPGAPVIERMDGVLVPGFVDAHCRVGLRAGPGGASGNLAPGAALVQSLDPADPAFAAALDAGITTVVVTPGGPGPVAGPALALKTAGGSLESRVLKDPAGVEVTLAGAGDLPATLQSLRDLVKRAKGYHEAFEKYEKAMKDHEKARKEWEAAVKAREKEAAAKKDAPPPAPAPAPSPAPAPAPQGGGPPKDAPKDAPKKDEKPELKEPKEPDKPAFDPSMEPFRAVFEKRAPVLARASSAAEIQGAVKVFAEEGGVGLVVLQAEEAGRAVAELRKAGVGCLLGPGLVWEERGETRHPARDLARAGIPFGLGSDASSGARDLPALAGYAVRHGLAPGAALRALTLGGARLLGLDGRVGSLEPGRDADIVLLSGDPFSAATRVRAVWIGGKVVRGEP